MKILICLFIDIKLIISVLRLMEVVQFVKKFEMQHCILFVSPILHKQGDVLVIVAEVQMSAL